MIKYPYFFGGTCYIFTTREFGHLESTHFLTLYTHSNVSEYMKTLLETVPRKSFQYYGYWTRVQT
jgi:hypothetical protein